ncbi:MAG: hypothetical protein ABIT20_07075 [Gemmatimonadaceae bacterium]
MTKRTLASMIFMTSLSACLTSPPPLTVAKADPQRGTFGSVYMIDGRQHYGELLALDDSTVAMQLRNRIAIGSLSRIQTILFDDFATNDVGPERHMAPGTLRKGRQVSRFPYGITAPAMARLLDLSKQSAPDRLEGTTP